MAPPIVTIHDSFRDLLKVNTGSANVALRNALGNGANSIIRADELTLDTIPTLPCLAIRWQTGGGARDDVQRFYPFVYIYDGLQKYFTRIDPIIPLLKAVFVDISVIPYCETDYRAHSGEITDQAFSLRCKYLPFVIVTR